MVPLIRYMLASYTRSYRYFAPIAFMLISVVFIYSYRPNPVMDSYAVTAALLFAGSAWLGMNFLNHDQGRQSMLLMIHTGSQKRYYYAQYMTAALISMIFSIFAVVYPIVSGMFDKPITLSELVTGYLGHAGLSLLGVSLSLYFQFGWIENQGRAAGLLFIVMVISLAGLSLADHLPAAYGFIPYVIPPVSVMVHMLMHADDLPALAVIATITYLFAYSFILFALYIRIACRKDAANLIRKVG